MSSIACYVTNWQFFIYCGIALSFLLLGFAIGYRFGKEDQVI